MTEEIREKRCARCGTTRLASREFFTKDRKTTDGWHAWCKECLNEFKRDKRAEEKANKPSAQSIKMASKGLEIMEALPQAGTLAKAYQQVTGYKDNATASSASSAFWTKLFDDDFAGDILKGLIVEMTNRHDIPGYIDKYMKAVFETNMPLPNEMNAALKFYFDTVYKA